MKIEDIKVKIDVDANTANQLLKIKTLATELIKEIDLLLNAKNEDC